MIYFKFTAWQFTWCMENVTWSDTSKNWANKTIVYNNSESDSSSTINLWQMKRHRTTDLSSQLCIVNSSKTTLTNFMGHTEIISCLGKFFIWEFHRLVHSDCIKGCGSASSWTSRFHSFIYVIQGEKCLKFDIIIFKIIRTRKSSKAR